MLVNQSIKSFKNFQKEKQGEIYGKQVNNHYCEFINTVLKGVKSVELIDNLLKENYL